jgi:hypothetical protein
MPAGLLMLRYMVIQSPALDLTAGQYISAVVQRISTIALFTVDGTTLYYPIVAILALNINTVSAG